MFVPTPESLGISSAGSIPEVVEGVKVNCRSECKVHTDLAVTAKHNNSKENDPSKKYHRTRCRRSRSTCTANRRVNTLRNLVNRRTARKDMNSQYEPYKKSPSLEDSVVKIGGVQDRDSCTMPSLSHRNFVSQKSAAIV